MGTDSLLVWSFDGVRVLREHVCTMDKTLADLFVPSVWESWMASVQPAAVRLRVAHASVAPNAAVLCTTATPAEGGGSLLCVARLTSVMEMASGSVLLQPHGTSRVLRGSAHPAWARAMLHVGLLPWWALQLLPPTPAHTTSSLRLDNPRTGGGRTAEAWRVVLLQVCVRVPAALVPLLASQPLPALKQERVLALLQHPRGQHSLQSVGVVVAAAPARAATPVGAPSRSPAKS
jgi:hypothetical protein